MEDFGDRGSSANVLPGVWHMPTNIQASGYELTKTSRARDSSSQLSALRRNSVLS